MPRSINRRRRLLQIASAAVLAATSAAGLVVVPVIRELSPEECASDVMCAGTMPEVHLKPGIMFLDEAHADVALDSGAAFEDAGVAMDASDDANACGKVQWGVDMIDQRRPNPDGQCPAFLHDGRGTIMYSLDTGLNCGALPRFSSCTVDEDAATYGLPAGTPAPRRGDPHGHGTAMAKIASELAVHAAVVGVPVLGPDGTGSLSRVLWGLHRVAVLHANSSLPGVVLAPLSTGALSAGQLRITSNTGGSIANLIDQAVQHLKTLNVVTVVSSGNKGIDACLVVPARSPHTITVAAMLRNRKTARFSNWGPCANIFAPADAVAGGEAHSGTSVSAAYAAGVMATIASGSEQHSTAAQMAQAILANATTRYAIRRAKGTPQRFVYAPRHRRLASTLALRSYKAAAIVCVGLAVGAAATWAIQNELEPPPPYRILPAKKPPL